MRVMLCYACDGFEGASQPCETLSTMMRVMLLDDACHVMHMIMALWVRDSLVKMYSFVCLGI